MSESEQSVRGEPLKLDGFVCPSHPTGDVIHPIVRVAAGKGLCRSCGRLYDIVEAGGVRRLVESA